MKREVPRSTFWPILIMVLASGVLWTSLAPSPGHAQGSDSFRVIVNASNPISKMPRKTLGRVFLKKQESWPNGFAIIVVDLKPTEPARLEFSRVVLQKDPTAVEAYWSKLIFSGMGVPPVKFASSAEVVDFVGKNVGSIGYVSTSTELGGAVKELEVSP